MALLQRDEKRMNNVETIIGPSVKVEGNFVGEGDVIVEGIVSGSVKTAKNLQVGQSAKIQADVEAENVSVAGEIRGNVNCRGKLELTTTAKVIGNVHASQLSIAEGAVLHGKCSMLNGKEAESTQVSADSSYEQPGKPRR
jgi:cytoskeletal protein CcmA (bactofilin family)